MKFDDIRVISEFLKEHDLSESSLGICLVSECIENLLDGNNFPSSSINSFPDNSIGLVKNKMNGNVNRAPDNVSI